MLSKNSWIWKNIRHFSSKLFLWWKISEIEWPFSVAPMAIMIIPKKVANNLRNWRLMSAFTKKNWEVLMKIEGIQARLVRVGVGVQLGLKVYIVDFSLYCRNGKNIFWICICIFLEFFTRTFNFRYGNRFLSCFKEWIRKKWHCYSRKVFVQIVTVCDHYGYLKCKGES